ncbi:MAG: hypothetical protein K0Q82_111 [Chryseobacterium indoltheticum]|jgi:hypothetical protein|nr:hypothetical protein [Chryseobacterium indoltheticum]
MRLSIISIILSFTTIFISVKINFDIVNDYLSADGKSQALYGFIELKYLYKYYFLLISLISLLFLVLAFKIKELKLFQYSALFILILGISSVFIDFWKWFV